MSSLLCTRAFISMPRIFLQVRSYKPGIFLKDMYLIYRYTNSIYLCHTTTFVFFRRHNDQSDVLNCDLTDTNTTSLDQYNPRHFVQNTITDVYQLYYKNDGSLYCDNLRDAGNKKLIMFIKPNSDSRNENNGLNHSMTIYEKNLDVTTENSVELQNYGKGIGIFSYDLA